MRISIDCTPSAIVRRHFDLKTAYPLVPSMTMGVESTAHRGTSSKVRCSQIIRWTILDNCSGSAHVISQPLQTDRTFWQVVIARNDNFGILGFVIIGLFAVSWIISIAFYKWRRFDDLDVGTVVDASTD